MSDIYENLISANLYQVQLSMKFWEILSFTTWDKVAAKFGSHGDRLVLKQNSYLKLYIHVLNEDNISSLMTALVWFYCKYLKILSDFNKKKKIKDYYKSIKKLCKKVIS